MFSTDVGGVPGPTPGEIWSSRPSGYNTIGTSAVSRDGTRFVRSIGSAVELSTDDGLSWTSKVPDSTLTVQIYQGCAISSNGQKIAVCGWHNDGGHIFTSSDGGSSWTQRATDRQWFRICMNDDGTKLVAESGGVAPHLFTSTDSGVTWTARSLPSAVYAGDLCSSALGDRVFLTDSGLYRSTDYGVNWTKVETYSGYAGSISVSSDGMTCLSGFAGQPLRLSIDGGTTWTNTELSRQWSSCAVSSDGSKLIAQVNGGQTFISTDGGNVWLARGPTASWNDLSCSGDGQKLISTVASKAISIGEY